MQKKNNTLNADGESAEHDTQTTTDDARQQQATEQPQHGTPSQATENPTRHEETAQEAEQKPESRAEAKTTTNDEQHEDEARNEPPPNEKEHENEQHEEPPKTEQTRKNEQQPQKTPPRKKDRKPTAAKTAQPVNGGGAASAQCPNAR